MLLFLVFGQLSWNNVSPTLAMPYPNLFASFSKQEKVVDEDGWEKAVRKHKEDLLQLWQQSGPEKDWLSGRLLHDGGSVAAGGSSQAHSAHPKKGIIRTMRIVFA